MKLLFKTNLILKGKKYYAPLFELMKVRIPDNHWSKKSTPPILAL